MLRITHHLCFYLKDGADDTVPPATRRQPFAQNGEPVDLGVYLFVAEILQNGETVPEIIKGNVTVVR